LNPCSVPSRAIGGLSSVAGFGFEFSLDELLAYNPRNLRYGLLTERTLDFATFLTTYRKEQKAA
jgi:hypothetical protein